MLRDRETIFYKQILMNVPLSRTWYTEAKVLIIIVPTRSTLTCSWMLNRMLDASSELYEDQQRPKRDGDTTHASSPY